MENIDRAMKEIPMIINMQQKINKSISSYGLKHVLERYRKSQKNYGNPYISNSEFIEAMDYLGFKSIKESKDSPNYYFNCSIGKTVIEI